MLLIPSIYKFESTMKKQKQKKPLKLPDATQSDISENELEERERQINKQLDQEMSMLIMEVGSQKYKDMKGTKESKDHKDNKDSKEAKENRDKHKEKRKKLITYPQIKFGLSDHQTQDLEKLDGSLRTCALFSKIIQREFQLNKDYVSENELLKPQLSQFKDKMLLKMSQIQNQREQHIADNNTIYCRPEEDLIQLRRYQSVRSCIHTAFQNYTHKYKGRKRHNRNAMRKSHRKRRRDPKERAILQKMKVFVERSAKKIRISERKKMLKMLEVRVTERWRRSVKERISKVTKAERELREIKSSTFELRELVGEVNKRLYVLQRLNNKQENIENEMYALNIEMGVLMRD